MRKITVADMLNLSIPERIILVEDIWNSIAEEADTIELTEDKKRIIDKRLEAYHKNPQSASPLNEVYQRIVRSNEI